MIAIIFEVWPNPDHQEAYLEMAGKLRKELESIDGFISIERFQSLTEEGKLVSISFFEDENAVKEWRNTLVHRQAQAQGKESFFTDYRLRVAEVLRDYGPDRREQAPSDSREIHG